MRAYFCVGCDVKECRRGVVDGVGGGVVVELAG